MNMTRQLSLPRDIEAVALDTGEKVTLTQGQQVKVTAQLDTGFTIEYAGRAYAVRAEYADALGTQAQEAAQSTGALTKQEIEKLAWDALRNCYDPEIPMNIVDLGLVYDCRVEPVPGQAAYRVDVKMTLTAPGCPLAGMIASMVQQRLLTVPQVAEANVELVWDPPWNKNMMSEAAKLQLGLL
ncbi:MAG: iron-sulfur cluster assembly protein [Verrucomicrobiae bacterium]|nr:iron-sulfur cluster assembly protein [Verrucomicrobiae bacterium]MDW7980724.1 iron-sulfur cluster assembly protein [Verrucomicrobiales bacterium]